MKKKITKGQQISCHEREGGLLNNLSDNDKMIFVGHLIAQLVYQNAFEMASHILDWSEANSMVYKTTKTIYVVKEDLYIRPIDRIGIVRDNDHEKYKILLNDDIEKWKFGINDEYE